MFHKTTYLFWTEYSRTFQRDWVELLKNNNIPQRYILVQLNLISTFEEDRQTHTAQIYRDHNWLYEAINYKSTVTNWGDTTP